MKGKIFNAQEVQSILDGSKVMFREICKIQPSEQRKPYLIEKTVGGFSGRTGIAYPFGESSYKVGQKIFCKESFLQKLGSTQLPSGEHETFFTSSKVEYVADGAQERWDNPNVFYPNWWKKRPAQHMKQEHSRLTLLIKEIRVEKLIPITQEDCVAEGVKFGYEETNWGATKAFKDNWNATHKKPEEKFEANPFVWVVDFKINK